MLNEGPKLSLELEMEAAVHSAKVFYQRYGNYLDGKRHIPLGKSYNAKESRSWSEEHLNIPEQGAVRGMEIVNGQVYPHVAKVIMTLARNGVVTKDQLATIEMEKLKSMPRIRQKSMEVVLLLRNICKAEIRIEELNISQSPKT